MSYESRKTQRVRSKKFIDTYLTGKIIDIGAGKDPVTSNAEIFDKAQGDAQYILNYKHKETYDCVYSSHCLEHMRDVPVALSQWWDLVKPGGYMIIVVPHEDLYEQGRWPSIFNKDHKATFRIKSDSSWSPVSFDIFELCGKLPNSLILESEIQDFNYDYNLQGKSLNKISRKIYKYKRFTNIKKFISKLLYGFLYKHYWIKGTSKSGQPVDQTKGNALAQIQIVIQKNLHRDKYCG